MNITLESLHNDVGLKFDENVVLGKEKVYEVIKKNQEVFSNLQVNRINNSQMLYGYNNLNYACKIGYSDNLIIRIIVFSSEMTKTRFKGIISYDGHKYNGFQIQSGQPTIQGELTRVISLVNGENTLVQGASRTDTGVHALNYVFHFDSDKPLTKEKWIEYLNYQLPNDIYVKSLEETHPLFHSRYDVYKKKYIYKIILNERNPFKVNYEWYIKDMDLSILKKNIEQLVGTHDFKSFCKGEPDSTIRTIYNTDVIVNGNEVKLVFEGNGFLRYMIRIIVYTLVQIANGKIDISINDIIKEKSREHTKNLAPACGLYLEEIMY